MLNGEPSATISQFVDDAKHIELLSEKGVSARLGLLLYGPPGTGKSLLAGHVAASLGKPFYIARLDSLISSRLGETAKNIRGVFEYVHAKKAVLFLDEMDAIAKVRDDRHELGVGWGAIPIWRIFFLSETFAPYRGLHRPSNQPILTSIFEKHI